MIDYAWVTAKVGRKIVVSNKPLVLRRTATVFIPGGRGLYWEGEAPAEPMPSSAGVSLSHWNPWQVVLDQPFVLRMIASWCDFVFWTIGMVFSDDFEAAVP